MSCCQILHEQVPLMSFEWDHLIWFTFFDYFCALNYFHAVSCKYHQYVSEYAEKGEWVRERERERVGAREGKSASQVVILMLIKDWSAAVWNI